MNSEQDSGQKQKWYLKISVLVIALLCVGPLALPLLWFNPRFSKKQKLIYSVVILILSYLLYIWFKESLKVLKQNLQQLKP